MIGKLKGRIDGRGPDWLIVDVGGVGYHVYCSGRTLAALPTAGEFAEIHTEMLVAQDSIRHGRERILTQLAQWVAMRGEEQVLHQLLRERGCPSYEFAFLTAFLRDLLQLRPVDSMMLIKTSVFGRNHRVLHLRRDPRQWYERIAYTVGSTMKEGIDPPLYLDPRCYRIHHTESGQSHGPDGMQSNQEQQASNYYLA